MALITSRTIKESTRMSDRIAKQDITEKNSLGQTVVLVAAGQPIPDGVDVPKSEAKKVDAPAENKARKRAASTKRKG